MKNFLYFNITNLLGNNSFRKTNKELYFELRNSDIDEIHTELVNKGFIYKKDKLLDYIQNPEIFCFTKIGDCDDYANLYFEILKYNKINCTMYFLKGESGHAVTMYNDCVYSNLKRYCGYTDINRFNEVVYKNKYKNIYTYKKFEI